MWMMFDVFSSVMVEVCVFLKLLRVVLKVLILVGLFVVF